jgi:glycosyltransferase involved in cell wall biosynthesis
VWYENFPLVIIEAFRQRTPVIVRNLGGMLEIVAESGGGFVYETDEELVAALTCRPPACAKWFLGFRTRFRERLCRIPRRTRA